MATSSEFIEFVCGQIPEKYSVRSKKMFGDYMIYVDEKPILLVCDGVVYVKGAEQLRGIMSGAPTGIPYGGAKEHYVLDVENSELTEAAIRVLLPITPQPKRKPKK